MRTLSLKSVPFSRAIAVLVVSAISAFPSRSADAQCAGRWLSDAAGVHPGMDGGVSALVRLPGGNLIAGGDFRRAGGVAANCIARWDGATWSPLGSGMTGGVDFSSVKALAVLPNGDLIAGGNFASAGGVAANNIARWNGSAWSALGAGVNRRVEALAVLPNGDLVAGGMFTSAGGAVVNGIARWDGANWSALGSGVSSSIGGSVQALAVLPNGDLIAGGGFTSAGGSPANRIARWNGTTWSALGSGLSGGSSGGAWALAVLPNGDLVAGGDFTNAGGVAASRIARWNGSAWSSVGGGTNNPVRALAVLANGDLVAGGEFTTAGIISATKLARWNGSTWAALGAGVSNAGGPGTALALAVTSEGGLVVGGTFDFAGGITSNNVAWWSGTAWSPLGFGVGSAGLSTVSDARALVVLQSGQVIAGGSFDSAGGVAAGRIARWNGSNWTPLGSGMDSVVMALAMLPGGDVVAGGAFTTAGGTAANRIARWNGTTWSPMGSGMNGNVRALAVLPNGVLVAAGEFTSAGGVSANRIAKWDGIGWTPLGSGMDSVVNSLLVRSNGDLVAAGAFTSAGGVGASRIARWNGTVWSALGSGVYGGNSQVAHSLANLPNGDLVVGGWFTFAGSVTANSIARWNGTSWSALGSAMANWPIYAVAVMPNGDVVAGGQFPAAGGTAAVNIARWSGSSWLPMTSGLDGTLNTNFPSRVLALATMPGGELVAVGQFLAAGGVPASCWARWSDTGVPWVFGQPSSQSSPSGGSVTLNSACASGYDFSGPVTFQWRRNGVAIANGPGGASPGGGTVAGASGALTSTSLSAELTVTGIRPSDAGQYTVEFTNGCGSAMSESATVTVANGCPADLSGDGTVDGVDLGILLGAWGAASADLSGDGVVNGIDLGILLGSWGLTPC